MTDFWLFLMFVSLTALIYGVLGLRSRSDTPAE